MSYSKIQILKNSNNGLAFFESVIPNLIIDGDRSEKTYNPFYNDTNPSMSIYFKGDRWYYRDYGDEDYAGDVFHFMSHYFELDVVTHFWELLQKMGKMLEESEDRPVVELAPVIPERSSRSKHFKLFKKEGPVTDNELEFVKIFGIDQRNLRLFDTEFIDGYETEDKEGKKYSVNRKEGEIMIAYTGDGYAKIYIPNPKKVFFLGTYPKDYSFGFKVTDFSNSYEGNPPFEFRILAAGEKDTLALHGLGFSAFTLNSESSRVPESLINDLDLPVIVLYDADSHGKKASTQLVEKYGFLETQIPQDLVDIKCKDVSDCISRGYGDQLYTHIIQSVEEQLTEQGEQEQLNSDTSYTEFSDIPEIPVLPPSDNSTQEETATVISKTEVDTEENDEIIETVDGINFDKKFPIINPSIYNQLPWELKNASSNFSAARDKDVFLLSSLITLSGCFPNTGGYYFGDFTYTNLFGFITAPASAGKGIAKWGIRIAKPLDIRLLEESKINKMAAEADAPEGFDAVVPIRAIFIPGNISSKGLYVRLAANNGYGIIAETEADTLTAALLQNWGDHSDVYRKSFENETASLYRATDDEFIHIEEPKLGILTTGTAEQLLKMIPDPQNGLFSRFLIYRFNIEGTFKNPSSSQFGKKLMNDISDFGQLIIRIYDKLNSRAIPLEIELTSQQWEQLTETFGDWQNEYMAFLDEESMASVRRLAKSMFRIAMILTVIRNKDELDTETLICSDEDFNNALTIVETIKQHILNVYSMMKQPKPLREVKSDKIRFYDALPDYPHEFSLKEAKAAADDVKMNHRTAQNNLRRLVKSKFLGKLGHNRYVKPKPQES